MAPVVAKTNVSQVVLRNDRSGERDGWLAQALYRRSP